MSLISMYIPLIKSTCVINLTHTNIHVFRRNYNLLNYPYTAHRMCLYLNSYYNKRLYSILLSQSYCNWDVYV